ncbi:hypothetical protein Goshw_018027 [Gossypium schwendimanii]|uniref:Uncharacterized protein n=1 Tax=Gossypium schwendimanii TaxID=34291 RepID=A0A7J9LAE4_GOSSC|nr:hypothetical protein [Gossypium schwendimanii]
MRLSEPGSKQHSEKKVIVWLRDMYQSYGTSPVLVWISTYFVPSPNSRILLMVASHMGRLIWCLQ